MHNTLILTGKIPFASAADALTAYRALDGMLAAKACKNYSDCRADVLHVDVEMATTKTAQEIATTLAGAGALSGVVVAKDPDAGLGDEVPTVAVIPISNGKERLSLLNHALGDLRENPAYTAAMGVDAMDQIEIFARSLVSPEPPQPAEKKETHDMAKRDEISEWVGLHYGVNFDAEPKERQMEWVKRHADLQAEHEAQENDLSMTP